MNTQNNIDIVVKKPSNKRKIIVGIIIVCAVAIAAVFAVINFSISPAERTVKAFMEAFKEDNYFEMRQQCNIYAFDFALHISGVLRK